MVLVLLAVAHARAFRAGLVWLDHAHLENGAALRPPSGWHELFLEGFAGTGYYRPLVAVSLSLDALVGSGAPWVYHATTLAFHALATLLLAAFGRALGLARGANLLIASIFAVHPATAPVAQLIAFRSEAMTLCGLLLMLLGHRRRRLGLALVGLVLAALSKETGFVLTPLLISVHELDAARRTTSPEAPATGVTRSHMLLGETGVWLALLALRLSVAVPWRGEAPALGLAEGVTTRLAALGKTLRLLALVAPDTSVCDDFPVVGLGAPDAWLGGAAVLGLSLLALRRGGVFACLALSLLPALQLVPVPRFWSAHYAYLPLAFFCLALGSSIPKWLGRARLALTTRSPSESTLTRLALILPLALAFWTAGVGRRFVSDSLLWSAEIDRHPACREAHFYLGEVARRRRDFPAAERAYRAALTPTPGVLAYVDRRAAHANLGTVLLELRRAPEARAQFAQALEFPSNEIERRQLRYDFALAALYSGDAPTTITALAEELERPDPLPAAQRLDAAARQVLAEDAARAPPRRAGPTR
ncbi:MAG: hypothetical protein ABI134_23375 [Byssovorax sp.]